MSSRVYITGLGIISAIGDDVSSTLAAIKNRHSGVEEVRFLKTRLNGLVPIAEVKHDNHGLQKLAGATEDQIAGDGVWSRTDFLGMIAVGQALRSAGITNAGDPRTGLISATSVGGMDKYEIFFDDFAHKRPEADAKHFIRHDCGNHTERIADHFGIRGFMTTISTACSSSANSIMLGARLIKAGLLDRVIAGGADAMARFTLKGFNSLKILDSQHCQPFDENRRGLNLGEGAGFVVLESESSSAGKDRLAVLSGYGNANDAYHQTASSPEGKGAKMAMQKAFEVAGILPREIDYINAHGTGTANNDLSEGLAIEQIFGRNLPPVSSTKPFTGHTLGAAGGIEAVLSVLAIREGLIYPNLNFQTRMKELNFDPTTELLEGQNIRHVLSNSFGFGGNTSSLIISAV